MGYYDEFRVSVPEASAGSYRVERFTVSPEAAEFDAMRAAFRGGRSVPAGTYTRLMCGGRLWMSDTPDEISDHVHFMRRAEGRVLIHGLGLGMVARGCAIGGKVTSLTVVEFSPEVIALVGPWLHDVCAAHGVALEVIEGDAMTWQPAKGLRWDAAWHDIWENISAGNLADMKRLHRRFARRASWQGSWARGMCERYAGCG